MKAFGSLRVFLLPLAFSILLIQSCSAPPRQLVSVTISPPTGAPGTGTNQVQFVATGHYNTEPYTVTPLQANWGRFDWTVATIGQNGLAACTAAGASTIEAWVVTSTSSGPVCNVIDPAGRVCGEGIGATAQLTCP